MAPTIVNEIPPGAVRIHLGSIETTLSPRGSLEKESLSLTLLERLEDLLEHWTSDKYGDSLPVDAAVAHLLAGLQREVDAAVAEFIRRHV